MSHAYNPNTQKAKAGRGYIAIRHCLKKPTKIIFFSWYQIAVQVGVSPSNTALDLIQHYYDKSLLN
jgi:hypothetical protein